VWGGGRGGGRNKAYLHKVGVLREEEEGLLHGTWKGCKVANTLLLLLVDGVYHFELTGRRCFSWQLPTGPTWKAASKRAARKECEKDGQLAFTGPLGRVTQIKAVVGVTERGRIIHMMMGLVTGLPSH